MKSASLNKAIKTMKSMREVIDSNKLDVTTKFEKIVGLVCSSVQADACACYVGIDGSYLELFAAVGFNKSAINKVSIRYGEGIVGDVAKFKRLITTADAWKYPNFSYKKEIGEDDFKSFLGVPLVRWNKAIGVLVVQRKSVSEFSKDEVSIFETLAMTVAEFIVSDEVLAYRKKLGEARGITLNDKIKGQSLNKGYGLGNAVIHQRGNIINKIFAENKDYELDRLKKAYDQMNADLDEKFENTKLGLGQHLDILDAYRMFAKDKGWYKKIESNVESGLTAEAAVERSYEDMWNRLSATTDTYLKERLHDLRDVSDRLQSYIRGDYGFTRNIESNNIIVVAKVMGPADLMDYDYKKIRGLVIEEGTPTMHVAIVAKALNIPVIANTTGVYDDIKTGDLIAIDGDEGYVYIKPSSDIQLKIQKKVEKAKALQRQLAELRDYPSTSLDGIDFNMYINVGLSFDVDYLESTNCDGIGLYRTEIPFMTANSMPTVEQQLPFYKDLMIRAKDKKVVFRSLDVGSDKLLPYWSGVSEENPALGWRSIRITLDRRAILRKQLRAFIRSSAGKELNVMFPMISNLEEFKSAKETLLIELDKEEKVNGKLPTKVNVGLMIEVPSVVYQLDEILQVADFISVGTNDLAQFFFACDRGNSRLNDRYDVLSAPFLRLLKDIVSKADCAGVTCSVCGEMASNPIEALALIGLGYRNLSSSGISFGKIKSLIRTARVDEIEDYMNELLKSPLKTVRPQLVSYAYDHAIEMF